MPILPSIEQLELQPSETITGSWPADHELDSPRPKRGALVLTNQRLAFCPLDLGIAVKALALLSGDWRSSAEPWSLPLTELTKVEDEPASKRNAEEGKVIRIFRKRRGHAPLRPRRRARGRGRAGDQGRDPLTLRRGLTSPEEWPISASVLPKLEQA